MALSQRINLRAGVVIERGEPCFDEVSFISNKLSRYYIVDRGAKNTIMSIPDHTAQVILGLAPSNDADRAKLIKELKEHHVLHGQHSPKKAVGSLNQKVLFQSIPIKLPFDIDAVLARYIGFGRLFFSECGLIALGVVSLVAMLFVARQFNTFSEYTSSLFSSSYLMAHGLAFGIAFICIKAIHELAHGLACKRAGGVVEGFVITFIAGAPMPSTRMNFLHKAVMSDRLWIALAGIYVELWIAALSALCWVITPESELRVVFHYLAVVNPVLTLGANLVPVMKFDGYQFWSILLRNPKLHEMAVSAFRSWFQRFLGAVVPVTNLGVRYQPGLAVYGALIVGYKTFVLPLGMFAGAYYFFNEERISYVVILIAAQMFWITPFLKEIKTMRSLTFKPSLTSVSLGAVMVLLCLWIVLVLPHVDRVEGAVVYERTQVGAPGDGYRVSGRSSGFVSTDDELIELTSSGLSYELASLLAQHNEVQSNTALTLYDMQAKSKTLDAQYAVFEGQAAALNLRAPSPGYWTKNNATYYAKGTVIGELIHQDRAHITVFMPKHITTEKEIKIAYSFAGGTSQTVVVKESDIAVTSALPAFVLDKNGGAFISKKPIQSIQRYTALVKDDVPEGPISVYVKTHYSLARLFFNRLKEQLYLL